MPKQVFAHLCTWFKTRDYSGGWEMWNSGYSQNPHDPDVTLYNGKRDIAATDYPLSGPYDSSDENAIDMQFSLMKAAGIDGIIVDWDGRRLNPYRHEMFLKILPHLSAHSLKLIVCFEEWCGYYPPGTFNTRQKELEALESEINWLKENILNQPYYACIGGKKPVYVFRKIPPQWLSANEWQRVKDNAGKDIKFYFNDCYDTSFNTVADGWYFWVGGFEQKTNSNTLEFCKKEIESFTSKCAANSPEKDVIPSVVPGFDDTPVWGWGELPRIAPRYGGERYKMMWDYVIEKGYDTVQIVTWNDWNEGSQIEPSERYGYEYILLTAQYAAKFKGALFSENQKNALEKECGLIVEKYKKLYEKGEK